VTGAVLPLAGAGLRGRRKAGMVAIFVVLLLAAVGIASGLAVSGQGAVLLDRVAADADVAHLVVYGDPSTLRELAHDPEVKASAGPFATANADLVLANDSVNVTIAALDDRDVAVGRPVQRAGRWAEDASEIVFDRSFAADLGVGLGDQVSMRAGRTATFTVVGTAVNLTDCFYPQCSPGRAWATNQGLARLGAEPYSQLWLRFDDPAQADPFLQRQAQAGVRGIGGTDSWLDTRRDFLTLDRIFGAFVSVFGLFVLAAAAVVVAGSMAARLVQRQREIGLLGAIGCTPRQVSTALLLENLAIGVVAAVAGWFVAGFLAPSLQLGIGAALGPQDPTWTRLGFVVTVVAITGMITLGTLVPALRAAHRRVTDVLRDLPAERTSRLTRHFATLPRRLPMLGVREVASRPTRGALTALAITVAVIGAVVSLGFVGAVDSAMSDPSRAGDPWDVMVATGDASSVELEAAVATDPHVAAWYSELWRRSTFQSGAFMSVAVGGDPADAHFRIGGGRSMQAVGEAVAGYGFLKRFAVSVGDTVSFLAGTTPLTVRIVGWYRATQDSGEMLRYRLDTLTTAEPGVTPDTYRLVAAEGTSRRELAEGLTSTFGSSVRVETIDTNNDALDTVTFAIRLVALILMTMAAINLLTSLLTTTRESARRVGVEAAVGFTPRQLVVQGAVSGAALGLAGVIVGLPVGLWLFGTLADLVSAGIGVGPGWMPLPTLGQVGVLALAAVVVSAGLGAVAARQLARRSVAELVRWE
jgi:putative ABC transport system permease protein